MSEQRTGEPVHLRDRDRRHRTRIQALVTVVAELSYLLRQVEAALAPSQDADGVTLDYRVYESRPWSVFAQSTNTGTARTARRIQAFTQLNISI